MSVHLNKIIALEEGRKINALRKEKHFLQQLFWECTLRCNLKCRHCGSSCEYNDSRGEMPLEDFLPVLDEINRHTTSPILVITTGGEPLLRRDICICGEEIKKRGFYWGLVTNGVLLDDKKLKDLLNAGLDTISVSIDGLRDSHNWMRSSESSYDHAIYAVKLLSKVSSKLTWDVITCINQRNISQLQDMLDEFMSHGVKRWKIFTVFPMGRANEDEEMFLSKDQLIVLFDFIKDIRKKQLLKISYGCEGFLGRYEYEVRDSHYFCAAGINVASILHDGSISGCLSIRYDYKQGNIYKDSFMDVWDNLFDKYRKLDWKKNGVCADCEAWRWCEGNGMHLRDNDGTLRLCNYQKIFHNNNKII